MKNSKKKIFILFTVILCIILVAVSVYFAFFSNSTQSDNSNLLGVFIPESSPCEHTDDTSSLFAPSISVFELNNAEKEKAEADVLSNDKWKKYIDSDYEVREKFNMLIFNSNIEPDLENCYLAFYDYGVNKPDLSLSYHPESDENVITFSSYLLAVYDMTNGKYYLIECLL